jgi:hypothetical protein
MPSTKQYPPKVERLAMRILIALRVAAFEVADEAVELNWPNEVSREVFCDLASYLHAAMDNSGSDAWIR